MYLLYTVHVVYSGKTTRQRALDRQRDEEIREKKLAEEKRLREEKRLADEAARKKAIKDRKVSTLGCPSPPHPFCGPGTGNSPRQTGGHPGARGAKMLSRPVPPIIGSCDHWFLREPPNWARFCAVDQSLYAGCWGAVVTHAMWTLTTCCLRAGSRRTTRAGLDQSEFSSACAASAYHNEHVCGGGLSVPWATPCPLF